MEGEPTTAGCRAVADRADAGAERRRLPGRCPGGRGPHRRAHQPARAGPRGDRRQPVVRDAGEPARPRPRPRWLVERLGRRGRDRGGGRGLRQRHRRIHPDPLRLLRHRPASRPPGAASRSTGCGRSRRASTRSGRWPATSPVSSPAWSCSSRDSPWPTRRRGDLAVGRLPIEPTRSSTPPSTGPCSRAGWDVQGPAVPGMGRGHRAGRPPARGRGVGLRRAPGRRRTPEASATTCGSACSSGRRFDDGTVRARLAGPARLEGDARARSSPRSTSSSPRP